MRLNDDGKTVAAADLLVPGVGEIIGGSQREERYDVLRKKIEDLGMDMSYYEWYLDLRKYGGVKHAGFGLRLRAHPDVPHGYFQYPRRNPVSQNDRQHGAVSVCDIYGAGFDLKPKTI